MAQNNLKQMAINDAQCLIDSIRREEYANAKRNAKALLETIETILTEELYSNDSDEPYWNK